MPDPTHCENESNPGIEDALQQNSRTFGKVERIPETIANLQDLSWEDMPDYITNPDVHKITDTSNFDASTHLIEKAVNVIYCSPGENLNLGDATYLNNNGQGNTDGADTIPPDLLLNEIVIVGIGCDFVFDSTMRYEDAIIATTATGKQTFSGSAGITLGRNDKCEKGGELALITQGDINFSAQMAAYDVEMIVAGDVQFASLGNKGDSIHLGTNVWAGGNIKVTTKHTFEGCADSANDPTVDIHYTLRFVE